MPLVCPSCGSCDFEQRRYLEVVRSITVLTSVYLTESDEFETISEEGDDNDFKCAECGEEYGDFDELITDIEYEMQREDDPYA